MPAEDDKPVTAWRRWEIRTFLVRACMCGDHASAHVGCTPAMALGRRWAGRRHRSSAASVVRRSRHAPPAIGAGHLAPTCVHTRHGRGLAQVGPGWARRASGPDEPVRARVPRERTCSFAVAGQVEAAVVTAGSLALCSTNRLAPARTDRQTYNTGHYFC
jgi:hypothetical protein